ncbi:MAG: hypothetical protein JNK05_35905 [Myxococcales bacterium]|nr:hypothetical protein [Myxococcales bacterium]
MISLAAKRLVSWVLVSFVACGCAAPVAADAGPEPEPPLTGRTLTYVISSVRVDETPGESSAVISGFDLDGVFAVDSLDSPPPPSSCFRSDYLSELDPSSNCPTSEWSPTTARCRASGCVVRDGGAPDGASPDATTTDAATTDAASVECIGGVDNALPLLTDAVDSAYPAGSGGRREIVARAFARAHTSVLLLVRGVDSLEDDPLVRVSIVRGVPLFGGGNPARCDAASVDQQYAALAGSVRNNDPTQPIVTHGVGAIRGGRLHVTFAGTTPFPFYDVLPGVWQWNFERVRFAVDLREDRGVRGNFGAAISVNEIVARWTGVSAPYVPYVVASLVDLQVDGVCGRRGTEPNLSGLISLGFHFELTRAVLAPRVLSERLPDGCPLEPLLRP